MKRIILLGLILLSISLSAQDFYSTGDCKASFKFEVNPDIYTTLPATAINFYDTSEGNVIAWYWDFGDSITNNEQNPMFIFNHSLDGPDGKIDPYRTVNLTIITADNCKSTFSQTINILEGTVYEPQSCIAIFKYNELVRDTTAGTATVNMINYSEGKDLSYFWRFGDDLTSSDKEPTVTLSTSQAEYKVCLTVTGTDSCTSIMCEPVYLQYPVIIDTIISDTVMSDCFVEFKFDKKDILMTPLPSAVINFYYKAFPEPTEWYWDFGDGSTSNEPNPTHIYIQSVNADSTFIDSAYYFNPDPFRTVCLTVITADGCKTSYCDNIQIFGDTWTEPEPEKCPVYFKYSIASDIISIPEVVPIQLVDVSEGEILSRLWEFEDGTTRTEKEPIVTFNIFQPVHKVCLTVTFADSCTNTYCSEVYVNDGYVDTVIVDPVCPYYIKVDGGFPIEMSSCAGWASAKVYLYDTEVTPILFSWSNGDTLPKTSGLCPTQNYTIKALMPDGCSVWTNFVLSADGTITPDSPVYWRISGEREKMYVQSDAGAGMKVEWRLCDGTMVEADSIPLDAINCGGDESNLIIKDSLGNVIYSENISLKGSVTGIGNIMAEPDIKLWPNPVNSKLNIRYSGEYQSKINIEICDIMGKVVSIESFTNISDGHELSINTESLIQGIYICRITSSGKIIKAQKFSRR